jgi:pSer/pThr/pTyr-binding forkhead associated (FHA) protein
MQAVPGAPPPVGPPRARAFLVLPDGARLEVKEAPLVVGRAQLQGAVAPALIGRVSRAHFCVFRKGDGFVLQDGGTPAQLKASLNGTWVSRAKAGPQVRAAEGAPVPLQGGESVDVAHVVNVRFVIEGR